MIDRLMAGVRTYDDLLQLRRQGMLAVIQPGYTLEVHSCDGEVGSWSIQPTCEFVSNWQHLLPPNTPTTSAQLAIVHEDGVLLVQ